MFNNIPICRVCLKSSLEYIDFDTPFVPDLPYKNTECLTYLDCFRSCTRLEVEFSENVPQSLCSSCGLELKVTYEFLKKAENAAKILRDAVEHQLNFNCKTEGGFSETSCFVALLENETVCEQSRNEIKYILPSEKGLDDNVDLGNSFNCKFCGEQFFSQFILNFHLSRSHPTKKIKEEEIQSDSELEVAYIDEDKIFLDFVSAEEETIDDEKCNAMVNIWERSPRKIDDEDIEIKVTLEKDEEWENKKTIIVEDSPSLYDQNSQYSVVEKLLEDQERKKRNEAAFKRCKICYRFIKASSYKSHMNIHEGAQCYLCSNCPSSFYSKRSLQLHARSCHQVKSSNTCKTCDVDIGDLDMKQHIEENHNRVVSCSKCDFKGLEFKLADHMRRQHSESKDFLCNICSKTFCTLGILNAHIKYHERKMNNFKSDACEICGKQFSTNHYLRSHMEVHKHDRKLFKCDSCDKMYVSKTALDNHLKLHKGETKNCLLCSKKFARQYELNVHMRFHTREYPFECAICGKKFAIKGHLRTHMWRHQGLKLQCEDCGKLFTSTKALQEHSFTHSEMPFPCPYCPKAYPSKQKFKVHLKTAHELEFADGELQKFCRFSKPKQLVRKKVTLVQADTIMKEIEIKSKDNEDKVDSL